MSHARRAAGGFDHVASLEPIWTREAIRILHEVAPTLVSPAITALAKAGDIVRCNAIYESGILPRCVDRHVAYSILPIKSAVEDGELVKFLVDDWIMQLRGYEAPRVNAALREIDDPDVVRELLRLGANPNVLKGARLTPVGAALHAGHFEAMREMLLSLRDVDQAPMVDKDRSIFDCALDPTYGRTIVGKAMSVIHAIALDGEAPRSFRRAAGQALHSTATRAGREKFPLSIQNALELMTYATLPAANYWEPVMSAGEPISVSAWLAKEGAGSLGARVLRNLVSNNFDIDASLTYTGPDSMDPRPLLHAAVSAGRTELVKLLLDLGANPWAPAKINGVESNAFTLARAIGATDSEAVLRATQASNKVVALAFRHDAPHSQNLKRLPGPQ